MSRSLLPLSVAAVLLGGAAFADAPRVAADIAPVHSLVAQVMEGVGTPDLIVQPGGSPHEYALRPSEAKALQDADLVFWVSHELTPWLGDAIGTLAADAAVTELAEADGTVALETRKGALFEKHSHAHEEHEHDHAKTGHDGHDHEAHEGHDKDEAHHEGHAGHDHAAHDHGAHDPHAWLSPENAAIWLNVIAGQLSAADPENAGAYFANAAAGRAELDALKGEINALLTPVRGKHFIVFHDAYQYFEVAFDVAASGAISLGDASDPSPARLAEIRGRIADEKIDCVLSEPQFNPGLVAAVLDGTEAKTGVIDPLGSDLEPGPTLYPRLLRNLAKTLAGCV